METVGMIKFAPRMPVGEYVTVEEAVADERVSYTPYWVRYLCREGKVECEKVDVGARGVWLLKLDSLLEYIARMEREKRK